MANKEQVSILKQGYGKWNRWRRSNPDVKIDLRRANLNGANLDYTDLWEVNLDGASLKSVTLVDANLYNASLRGVDLSGGSKLWQALLKRANFSGANLNQADFSGANLIRADLSNANLTGANLSQSIMVETILQGTKLTDCAIYGISAWNVKGEPKEQLHLNVSPLGEPAITVDNLEVAQFIYLMLNNRKIRDVIDTLTTRAVLILGRFTKKRKKTLDAIRADLRRRGFLPILFDFDVPAHRDITESVTTLARLSRFIIADLTDPRSIPQELTSIIPEMPSLPIQPLLLSSQREYGMYEHFKPYPWVLPIYRYRSERALLASLDKKVIEPAERKAKELQKRKS